MVLGTMPMAFADADQTAGEELKAYGFVSGDENGNLMEDQSLTRAQLAVLVAELNGVKENAKTYAIAPEFKDVKADDWFGPYVAYAAKEGWFKGDDEGNFNPNGAVSDQAMATVMLRALGYEPAWETAVSEAKAMGLPVASDDAAAMTRGEAFGTMLAVVNTPKKGSDVKLGVELGKLEPEAPVAAELVAEIDTAEAMGNGLVNVDFVDAVDAAAAGQVANYTIVEKADTTKEVAILSVDVYDGDDVFLETEGLTAGKSYTVIVGDSKANFAGIAKDSDKPSLDSVKGTDTGEIEVEFEDALVDRATAEDVANYSLEKEGTVVKAEVDNGLNTVTLTVEGMTSTRSQKLTVENVMSTDGVVMSKEIKSFGPKYDKSAPKLDEVEASDHNNVEVLITFDDDHGVDKATAEDVSNYSIDGLEIISAKATYINDDNDDYYDKVILTTSEQTKSKSYKLEVKYMVDGSTAANATTKVLSEKFRGGTADDDEPDVDSVEARNLTEIDVVFDEENALDVSTVLDAGNYEFDDNELEVVDVRFDDVDDNGNSYSYNVTGVRGDIAKDESKIKVILTVTEMEEDESYKLRINNIADNFGNAMDKEEKKTVKVSDEVKSYYQINTITANDLEEISLTFKGVGNVSPKVLEASAEDATNYVIDGGIGAVKSAELASDDMTVTLEVPKLTEGKTYKLTVNNVENYWGYAAENVTKSFIAANDDVDNEQPEVDDVSYENMGELVIEFDEPMRADTAKLAVGGTAYQAGAAYVVAVDEQGTTAVTDDVRYKFFLVDTKDDDKTLIFNAYDKYETATYNAGTSSFNAFSAPALVSGAAAVMPKDTDLEVLSFNSVTDLSNNTPDYTSGDEQFSTDSSVFSKTDDDDALEADSLSQENGDTIIVTFERPIKVGGTEESTVVQIPYYEDDDDLTQNGTYEFTYEITGDDDEELTFTKTSGTFPDDSVELRFNFNAMTNKAGGTVAVTDILDRVCYGKTVSNVFTPEVYTISVDNDDTTEPVLEEIEVVDNVTLLLHYSEKLKTTGSYKIIFEDEDDDDKEVTWSGNDFTYDWDDSDKKDVVELKLTGSRKFTDQSYDLHFATSPRDLANNKVEDEDNVTSFTGVDTAPAVKMIAAKVEGSQNITIVNDKEDFPVGTTTVTIDGTDADGNAVSNFSISKALTAADDELELVIPTQYALLSETVDDKAVTYTFSYNVTVGGTTTTNNYVTQSFVGTLEEAAATVDTTVTTTAGTIVLNAGDFNIDKDEFAFAIVDAAGNEVALTVDGVVTDAGIIKEVDGNVVIKDGATLSLTAGTQYKLVAYPLDDDNNAMGAIELISQYFTY